MKATLEGDVMAVDGGPSGYLPLDVGVFTGHRRAKFSSTIPCPYCRELMTEAVSDDPRRIAKVLERRGDMLLVIAQRIPATHRTLACYGCKAHFTVPREISGGVGSAGAG